MAISIDFLANASRFLRGTQDTQEALQHVGDSLDDLARDGDQATEKLERSFRDMAQNVKRVDVGTDIGRSMKRGTEEADEGVRTLKENTASNLKEVAASFDGTASGISDGFQGLIAEIAEGFGPAGLIAGAVAAGGLGLISAKLADNDEKTQEYKQAVADLTQQLIDAANAEQMVVDNLQGFATQTDSAKVSLADIRRQATDLGVPFERLARAYASGGDGLQRVLDQTNELIESERQQNIARQSSAGQTLTLLTLDNQRSRQLGDQKQKIIDLQKQTRDAQQAERDWIKAGGEGLQERADALDAYAGSVQDALHDAGADWEKYRTKQGVNLDKYNDALEDSIEATENYKRNVKRATKTLSDDALDYLLSLGEDAAPLLQQYVDAPKKLQGRTAANWDRLGRASADSYKAALEAGLPKTIKGPKVSVQLDYATELGNMKKAIAAAATSVAVTPQVRPGTRAP